MLAWLWNLFIGHLCFHRWEIESWCNRVDEQNQKIGNNYDLRCKKCGNMKKVRL